MRSPAHTPPQIAMAEGLWKWKHRWRKQSNLKFTSYDESERDGKKWQNEKRTGNDLQHAICYLKYAKL